MRIAVSGHPCNHFGNVIMAGYFGQSVKAIPLNDIYGDITEYVISNAEQSSDMKSCQSCDNIVPTWFLKNDICVVCRNFPHFSQFRIYESETTMKWNSETTIKPAEIVSASEYIRKHYGNRQSWRETINPASKSRSAEYEIAVIREMANQNGINPIHEKIGNMISWGEIPEIDCGTTFGYEILDSVIDSMVDLGIFMGNLEREMENLADIELVCSRLGFPEQEWIVWPLTCVSDMEFNTVYPMHTLRHASEAIMCFEEATIAFSDLCHRLGIDANSINTNHMDRNPKEYDTLDIFPVNRLYSIAVFDSLPFLFLDTGETSLLSDVTVGRVMTNLETGIIIHMK